MWHNRSEPMRRRGFCELSESNFASCCECHVQGIGGDRHTPPRGHVVAWPRSRVDRDKGREKPLTSAGDRALVGGLGSVPEPSGLPSAHNCMKRSTDDVQQHPQHQTSPVPGERHDRSRRNASAAPVRHSRGEADRGAEPMLGRPRFESLEAEQAAQAIELLSALILAAERPVLGRTDEPGRSGEFSGAHHQHSARRQRRSRLANGCTSDWQAQRRESPRSVAVSGGSPAPDCVGRSQSSRCS
jgi:hypothetical protein